MNNTSNSDNSNNDSAYYSTAGSITFILFMTFIALIAYCCSHRNLQNSSQRAAVMGRDISLVTIQVLGDEDQEAIVNSYPVMLYSEAKLLDKLDHSCSSTLSCSICLADYKDSEWLRLLPDCGHFFHKECVDTWLRLNMSCPICRNSPFPTPLAEVAPLATRGD
ncbi:hypothetical protein RIF29_21259 [Crotalaria pallida]|uniref:RING-type domain-containing protein n=1 Tax=Crotalaria pallida TaxID=3830 RepID=A0AAN9F711_CROPI